ncbi:uncharacterized protein [Euphorbia lathyris]|uniref:uncharacterized protein isoform X2 n=1 Tax=Euphorbia lathyris TaxID=212925 RepID=UPI0033132D5D
MPLLFSSLLSPVADMFFSLLHNSPVFISYFRSDFYFSHSDYHSFRICFDFDVLSYYLFNRKLLLYAASLWLSLSSLFQFFRVKVNEDAQTNNSICTEEETVEEKLELYSDCLEEEEEAEGKGTQFGLSEFNCTGENNVLIEEESPKFFFKFEYQIPRDNYEPIVSDSVSSATTSKYEEDSNLFVEEDFSFRFKELSDSCIGTNEIFVEEKVESEPILDEGKDKSADSSSKEEVEEKLESEICIDEKPISGKAIADDYEKNVWIDQQFWGKIGQCSSEKDLITSDSDSDSDTDSITSSHELFSRAVASSSDSFLSEKDFEEAFKFIHLRNSEDMEFEDMNSQNWNCGYEADDIEEADSEILEELDNLEESNIENPNNENSENLDEKKQDDEDEDPNGLEILWEHQELIEQLKMELKKVRATGLPTILEDDESPKIMEDLKPWKIDDKFQHEDRMGELHKFYRSYRERMRKFDIFNYQKMYAIGLLQSKDPLKSMNWSNKDSSELHSDLEMVYVAQMCLSWEILHWQYQKSLEIWDSDPSGIRRFNEVAGEFQQFQVHLQRFIENEPFEGPRIQNYVKNRCVLRNLLQVPVIREDNMRDKKGRLRNRRESDNNAIRSDTLVEILEESIRIFWRFVRADKDSHNVIQRSRKGTQIQPQDPAEVELLMEVRTSLLKREKKLKEVLRSGSCILRKFQKQKKESISDEFIYFFSQVDMKLVSRVLNMSKVTVDQLIWCRSKLNNINFVRRKINIEPSFLLFPC